MLSVVRQRGTPRPRLASRRELGTRASTSIVDRATSGSIRQPSAKAPARPLWPWPMTKRPKTKIPITIAGIPFRMSRTSVTASRIGTGAYSLMDGSSIRTPGSGLWNVNGTNLENYGVPPDVYVDNTPGDFLQGRDAQLEKAVEVLQEELKKAPAVKP